MTAYLSCLNIALLWTFGSIVLTLSAASCGGPASPSTSSSASTAQRLTVTGAAVLAVTQTAQLVARTSSGQDVTAQAAWQSSNADVVTVSAGLLTAKSLGSAAVTATYQGAVGFENIAVQAGGPPVSPTISACGPIVLPGAYVVANDLAATSSGPCLAVSSGSVQLDCRNHVIPSLTISGVANVTVANCTVTASSTGNNNLTNVTIDHSTLAGWTSGNPRQLTISNSHITGDGVTILGGTSSIVTNNTLDNLNHTTSGAITFERGSGNQARQNIIDGAYDGSGKNGVGQDDGVILGDESGDTIEGNTIRNVFDSGVEGVDFVHDTTIADNVILNAGTQGVGSYWCTNWEGNTVSGNNVSQSPALSILEYDVGNACINKMQTGSFRNNQIVGNIFRNPVQGIFTPPLVTRLHIFFEDSSVVSNNLIAGNDFGTEAGPVLFPIAGFVNGGGNICDPTTSPFCGGAPARPLDFLPVTETDTHYSGADQHRHDDTVRALASRRSRKRFLTSSCSRVATLKLLTSRASS